MFYQRIKAAAAGQVQRIKAAAGERITRAKKHPAGIAALYIVTIAEVGTLQAAVIGLKALALALYGMGGAADRIRKADRPGLLPMREDHQRTQSPTIAERIGAAWRFRADIMRENRGEVWT